MAPILRLDPKKRELVEQLRRAVQNVQLVERLSESAISFSREGGELEHLDARADRSLLLQNAKAGLISKLLVEGVTFIQRPKTPNRNYVRVKAGAMQALATSFEGQPVLRDHNTDLDARAGTILESKLERVETPDGTEYRIRMKMELVKQWAIVAVLDGTLDRWSVAFGRTAGSKVLCSVHNTPVFSKCWCWRGEVIDETGQIVEFVYTGAEGFETSGVTVPAVVGTSVDSVRQLKRDIRAQGIDVSALACMLGDEPTTSENRTMELAVILAALALPSTATVDDAAESIRKLKTDADDAVSRAELAEGKLEEEKKVRLAAETALETQAAAKREGRRDELLAQLKEKGKVAPGSKLEAALKKRAEKSFETFEAEALDLLETGAVVTPAGQGRQTPEVTVNRGDSTQELLNADPKLAAYLKNAGITLEQFEKYGRAKYEQRLAARE